MWSLDVLQVSARVPPTVQKLKLKTKMSVGVYVSMSRPRLREAPAGPCDLELEKKGVLKLEGWMDIVTKLKSN